MAASLASSAHTLTPADTRAPSPAPSAATRPLDFNGDGREELAVFRPGQGLGQWFIYEGATISCCTRTEVPVPGDYNGDGRSDVATWTPSSGLWNIRAACCSAQWGQPGDIPVLGARSLLGERMD
jgi:hypothetical protein